MVRGRVVPGDTGRLRDALRQPYWDVATRRDRGRADLGVCPRERSRPHD